MDFVHPKSVECTQTELDLFSVPPTQVSLEKGHWIDHQPVSNVSENGPITFLAPGTEDYVDMSKTILVARAKVTKANGGDIDDDTKVGPVNNFLHSLFKQVDVFLKGKLVTQATGTYPYRAYLGTLLNYGPSAKQSQLTAALFYKDTAGQMDNADPAHASPNRGLKTRNKFIMGSKIVDMAGPIFCDVFFGERYLLSYVDLKVVMNRTSDEFVLMSSVDGAAFRVKLIDAYLKVRKVKVNPSISLAHKVALKKGPAIYPVRRVDCKSFIIPSGNPSLQKDNLFNGLVPKSFVFGLVESASFNGAYKKNPFNFQHFNISSLGISINGESVPFKSINLSFGANPRFIEAFLSQFSGTGKMYYDTGNGITRKDFPNGFALFSADFTSDMCSASEHFNTVQKGNLAIDLQFSTPPTHAVSLVCYGEFENIIQIDGGRNVVYDYIG
ncbi:uncharacterized protein F54H12.2-like [Xenia sp. Carnegie-2017]|uniref:uncharacterized protein F54H12.2-like n=1 Tax=Xenia sp. Carnegie-2017 TaxID=2897299 RepID=UPI001F035C1C|nr:uncharacterized protein F54H12.2-like [Xenia sp. Carnegie-2017]